MGCIVGDLVERGVAEDHAPRRRPPGSIDVARLAGVSQKTVSRVLNDEPHVKDEVRQRVLRAARELGYRRNNAARALTSGRTRTIGVVALGSALYGPASLLVGIERAVRIAGYGLRVANTFEGDPDGVSGAVEALLEQGVDGIVLSEPIDEGPLPIDVDVPVVVFGRTSGLSAPRVMSGLSAPRVIMAGMSADVPAYAATRHLLDLGHPTVHHVAGPQRWFSARERLLGWRRALADAGVVEVPYLEGDWSAASGYAAGRQLLTDPTVTAVFAANDDMAVGLTRALIEQGRAVPDRISVVGFDDIPIAAYLNPPLTTVRQPFEFLAATALAALLRAIDNPQEALSQVSEPEVDLVLRGSTARYSASSSAPPADLGPDPPSPSESSI
jgi:DNA-binding LacI/PurR family transcriptional regulator